MKPSRITTFFLIAIILLLTGCQPVKFNLPVFASSPSPTVMPSATAVPPTATVQVLPTPTVAPTVAPTAAPKTPVYAPVIDPANFVIGVNNPYFPLKPGRSMTYTGKKGKVSLREQVAVTKNTRVVMGVTCMEVVDTLWEGGKLAQKTLRWYAQDKEGTVWYFGAEAKQYKKGKVSGMEGSWQAGAGGAQPGIIMLAHPTRGDTYRQNYLEGVVEDMAYVVSLDGALKVPYHAYKNLLITLNWSNLTPTVIEDRYYAKGVGFVYSEIVQGGKGEMKLVKIKK